jgi:hypothetical protein
LDSAAREAYEAQLQEYEDIIEQSQASFQTASTNFQEGNSVFTDGFLSMLAGTQGGRTLCQFDKAWLWLLEP